MDNPVHFDSCFQHPYLSLEHVYRLQSEPCNLGEPQSTESAQKHSDMPWRRSRLDEVIQLLCREESHFLGRLERKLRSATRVAGQSTFINCQVEDAPDDQI